MKKLTLFTILTLLSAVLLNVFVFKKTLNDDTEKIIAETNQYKHPINSIEMSEKNTQDLEFLKTVLKDNRIVFLGESVHQDGQTFKAKARLIKYLHENLGYNVVLYEAGQYDMWVTNEEMEKRTLGIGKDSIAGLGMFNFWWENKETRPLNNYYLQSKKTKNPITLGGFDIQFSGNLFNSFRSTKVIERSNLLKDFLDKNSININGYPLFKREILFFDVFKIKKVFERSYKKEERQLFFNELDSIKYRISKLSKTAETTIYTRYLNDVKNDIQKNLKYKSGTMKSMQFRDSLMAENLTYQLDSLYPNQKVIVWTANVHAYNKYHTNDFKPLGQYIKEKYKNQSYAIGFTSYGVYNPLKQITNTPNKYAIENVFHQLNQPYFFLDFRQIPSQSILKTEYFSVMDQGMNVKAKWSDFVDGIFYIDVNQVPTPLNEDK
ncbi:erythromycin esterase family protein [Empedobacter falsenii]|uniref:erythromycin esterase family protein n=1 Tax=Empedobacter falsenii TaxID=343874 RepID=UPI002575660B|nr:erythromycin esterase family protein [Empedobacter falsenii]MDM1298105.1 erythromycin esterase family protein [Empedobacter falsenii]MDM1317820.1 erythromycin esterase family protein [Empedobacter falsenii]